MLISYQTLEWFYDEFFSGSKVFEDVILKDKEACVDADARLSKLLDIRDEAIIVSRGDMVAQVWLNAQKCSNLVMLSSIVQIAGKIEIRQAIGVIG